MAAVHSTAMYFLIFVTIWISAAVQGADWGYSGATGPSTWSANYPACGGSSQTPINLVANGFAFKPKPVWSNYNLVPATMAIENNGHSLVVSATYAAGSNKPQITLVANQTFQLANVHFHWGKDNKDGSEHAILHKKYPLEMHAVHKRIVNGVFQGDLLVVGVLFDISWFNWKNFGIEKFISSTNQVTNAETSYGIAPFKWSDLIPEVNCDFFTYQGSLTTPPCSEVVTWIVKKGAEKVSQSQMDILRTLKNDDGEQMAGNFRPLQPVNGRPVTYVF